MPGSINWGLVFEMGITTILSVGGISATLRHECRVEESADHTDCSLRAAGVKGAPLNLKISKISAGPSSL